MNMLIAVRDKSRSRGVKKLSKFKGLHKKTRTGLTSCGTYYWLGSQKRLFALAIRVLRHTHYHQGSHRYNTIQYNS